MRIVLQRISEAQVDIEGVRGTRAGAGLLALVGFRDGDHDRLLEPMSSKIVDLRIFEDADGRMNRSLLDVEGDLVLVPQFTLYADCKKGRRPGFSEAMAPIPASELFETFCQICEEIVPSVTRGKFGADMKVHLVNDGPVTFILDSTELRLG